MPIFDRQYIHERTRMSRESFERIWVDPRVLVWMLGWWQWTITVHAEQARRAWLKHNGEAVAFALKELALALGCSRILPRGQVVPSYLEYVRPPVKLKASVSITKVRVWKPRDLLYAHRMRYLAPSPGKTVAKASRPRTNPRNGSYYLPQSAGSDSPSWQNIVRIHEDGLHDPDEAARFLSET